jgi:hypothetical protein
MLFMIGDYRLPFALFELHSFDHVHTHRTAWHTTWKEQMRLRLCVPFMPQTRLRIANDNKVMEHA